MAIALTGLTFVLAAQDFGVEWLDRVTHELEQPHHPLSVRPVETQLQAGILYAYDSNLFLDPNHEHGASVVLPFARARLDYAAPRWDAAADVLVDYRRYAPQERESGDDERAYGRLRFAGPRVTLEAAEILLHESDPVDVRFPERVDRLVSTTTGHAGVGVTRDLTLEADLLLGVVRFHDRLFDDSDNESLRAGTGAAWRVAESLEVLAQGGWLLIAYQNPGAPDARGAFGRLGIRGEPLSRLSVTALVGVTGVRSDPVPGTGRRVQARTGDISVNVRVEPVEGVVAWADYTREIGFAEPGDPFEIIDRILLVGEWQATPQITLRGRLEHDRAKSALGVDRTWWSVGPTATWSFSAHLKVDAGVAWRTGELGVPGPSVFTDVIAHAGVVLSR